MNLPYDEDYLRELELWPFFELQRRSMAQPSGVLPIPSTVSSPPATSARLADTPEQARRVSSPQSGAARPASSSRPAAPAETNPVVADPARIARIAQLDWDGLNSETAACQACKLCEKRKQAVLGVGALNAPWLFIGEGPGSEEDDQGEPFVGPAGKLLDAMLAAAGLQRGREVYIANVVKCRPPGNRNPSPEETHACAPLLDRQIELIQPKLIVALGKIALMRLTGTDASMASMRGKQHEYRGIPVIATYHPAYLLRNLPDKLKAWEDLMLATKAMATL
jgi:uracil-DNA glycosylase